MECIGCMLANKQAPVYVVYEDDYVCCFLDHIPFNEGHVLILPKYHVLDLDELDEAFAVAIMKASMLISKAIKNVFHPDGIIINQNGGIFNELNHYHMHVVPRYKNQSFATFYTDYDGVSIERAEVLISTQNKLVQMINGLIINT